MIVGINYNNAGWRYINTVTYCADWNTSTIKKVAEALLYDCDEVYIIDFEKDNIPLIDEIVLHGCRIGV